MPDTDEALGQNVEQKPAQEFLRGDGHGSLFVTASVIPPTEPDVVVIEGNEPMVGDGDSVGIAPEVADHLLGSTEGWFGINNPVLTK